MIKNTIIKNLNILAQYRKLKFEYPEYVKPKYFEGFLINFYSREGVRKYQYSLSTELKLISFLKFSFNDNGCDKANFELLFRPEELGFQIEGNDLIEIYFIDTTKPAWSGVIINEGNEWRSQYGKYQYEAIGFSQRLKGFLIKETYTNQTIDFIIKDLSLKVGAIDSRYVFDANNFENYNTLIDLKLDNVSALEAFQKLEKISGNGRLYIGGDREIYFKNRDVDVAPTLIFHSEDKAVHIQSIEKSKVDKIKNHYILERKRGGGGSKTVNDINQDLIHLDSINMYGEYFAKETIPEAVDDATAILYGSQKLLTTSFPQFKIKLDVDFPFFSKLEDPAKIIEPEGSAIVYNLEELFFTPIKHFTNPVNDVSALDPNLTLSLDSGVKYSGERSLRLSNSWGNVHPLMIPVEKIFKLENTKKLIFWVKTSNQDVTLSVGFLKTDGNFFNQFFPFTIQGINLWEMVVIDLENVNNKSGDISTIVLSNDSYLTLSNPIFFDKFDIQELTRKKYELLVRNVEYTFDAMNQKVDFELGSIEKPFVDEFVQAWRSVEALKTITTE